MVDMADQEPSRVDWQERVRGLAPAINDNFVIEGVFNEHGSMADAESSVAAVAADSLAFIEAFHTAAERAKPDASGAPIEDVIEMYTTLRLRVGKASTDYQHIKGVLLGVLDNLLVNPDPREAWELALRRALIRKDCAIIDTDLDLRSDDPAAQSKAREIREILDTEGETLRALTSGRGIGSAYREAVVGYQQFLIVHHAREDRAVARSCSTLATLASLPDLAPDLALTDDGKRRAYSIWGAAHARSLPYAYEDVGVSMRPNILYGRTPVEFFPAGRSEEELLSAGRRKVIVDLLAGAVRLSFHQRPEDVWPAEIDSEMVLNTSDRPIATYATLARLLVGLAVSHSEVMVQGGDVSAPGVAQLHRALESATRELAGIMRDLGLDDARYLRPATVNAIAL